MASVGHVFVGLAIARLHDRIAQSPSSNPRATERTLRTRVAGAAAFSVLAMFPDADVIGFRFGVEYGSEWGHRGALHSIVAAVVIALVATPLLARDLRAPIIATALCAIAAVVSHGLLDSLTDGGQGVALLWPFSTERYFAPWHPIPVAPIGREFLSARGFVVASTELVLFAPFLLFAALFPSTPRRSKPPAIS